MTPYLGLTLDAAGTLLTPRVPVATTYARIAAAHGVHRTEREVARGFARAFQAPRPGHRYEGDGRPFWRGVVAEALDVHDEALFEAIYEAFARAEAWRLAPGAPEVCAALRAEGVRVAVVSNWDLRLGPLLRELGADAWLDASIVSAEVEVEKPDPRIFQLACARLGTPSRRTLHVGDDRTADVAGARAAGLDALHFGSDVTTFDAIAARVRRGPVPFGT